MNDTTKCQGQVWDGWNYRRCSHNAQPGKPYCKQHDPDIIKAKREERDRRWRAEWAQKREKYILTDARMKATEGLTLEELEKVTPELIRKALGIVKNKGDANA